MGNGNSSLSPPRISSLLSLPLPVLQHHARWQTNSALRQARNGLALGGQLTTGTAIIEDKKDPPRRQALEKGFNVLYGVEFC